MNRTKKMMIWATLSLAISAGPQAVAEGTLVDQMVAACESDIVNYCSNVTPGNDRVLHCIAAHEDKISGSCTYALYQAAKVLEKVTVAIAYLAQECETEIKTFCSNVEPGQGRMLACLDEQNEQIGESCQKAIADTVGS